MLVINRWSCLSEGTMHESRTRFCWRSLALARGVRRVVMNSFSSSCSYFFFQRVNALTNLVPRAFSLLSRSRERTLGTRLCPYTHASLFYSFPRCSPRMSDTFGEASSWSFCPAPFNHKGSITAFRAIYAVKKKIQEGTILMCFEFRLYIVNPHSKANQLNLRIRYNF